MQKTPRKRRRTTGMGQVERFAAAHPGAMLTTRDFPELSSTATSKALSRLQMSGRLTRVAKGVYYVPKPTLLGPSSPSVPAVAAKVLSDRLRPTGVSAANMLGLTTQVPARPQVVIYGQAALAENFARVSRRKGRPPVTAALTPTLAALFEVLRDRGRFTELSPDETLAQLRKVLVPHAADSRWLHSLVNAALAEPPRVRAMLGALLETCMLTSQAVLPLRKSLNPLSRFDFGIFAVLPNARNWQAK